MVPHVGLLAQVAVLAEVAVVAHFCLVAQSSLPLPLTTECVAQLKLLPIFRSVLFSQADSDFEFVVLVGEENCFFQWLRSVVSVPVVPYSFALYTL